MNIFLKHIQIAMLVFALQFITAQLWAQGTAPGYLYVYPSDPSAYPTQQGGTSNPTLQGIFTAYQVVSYVQSFAGTQTQQLQNAYEIHCNGDVFILKDKLQSTGLFSMIELAGYYELASCPTSCTNPLTVNDPNAGYQFDITQAGCAWTITQGNPAVVVGVADATFNLNDDDLNDGQIVSVWGQTMGRICMAP